MKNAMPLAPSAQKAKTPVVFYTSLYPSKRKPTHGIFISELRKAVSATRKTLAVSPQSGLRLLLDPDGPWLRVEDDSPQTRRPIFWTFPRIFKGLDARLMAFFSRAAFEEGLSLGARIVHAHYAYPDAAAAMLLARRSGLPYVVTLHGSDINELALCPARRKAIIDVLKNAHAIAAVSSALVTKAIALGANPDRIRHIPNGVDLTKFKPADKCEARTSLDILTDAPLVLAVGRLVPVKGYDLLLQAFAELPSEARLLFAGDGPLRGDLERLSSSLGLSDRVHFAGAVAHARLPAYYQAADVLAVSSHNEGWPTIIFEAMACSLPVIAAPAGGIPEILSRPGSGLLLRDNAPRTLAEGITESLSRDWDRKILIDYASENDWSGIARQYDDLYEFALAASHHSTMSE